MTVTTMRMYGVGCANCKTLAWDATDEHWAQRGTEPQALLVAAQQKWTVRGNQAWCCGDEPQHTDTSIVVFDHVHVTCNGCGRYFGWFNSIDAAITEAANVNRSGSEFWFVMPDGYALCACAIPADVPDRPGSEHDDAYRLAVRIYHRRINEGPGWAQAFDAATAQLAGDVRTEVGS